MGQISGRSDVSFVDWMRLDHQYIDNWSPLYDFEIILSTIPRPKMPVPSTVLGRFAVAVNYQHRGVGTFLLAAALHQAYANSQTVASAFVVLDIADDASETAPALYRGFGFSPLPSDPRRMLLSMESILISL